MQPEDEIPPIPTWFSTEVLALLACYPSAQAGRATVAAWWRQLHRLPPDAVKYGIEKAPQGAERKEFPPSAFLVLDHAKAWRPPTPKPDLSRLALPEPEPELPPELAEVRERQKRGEISVNEATRRFLHWTVERLP